MKLISELSNVDFKSRARGGGPPPLPEMTPPGLLALNRFLGEFEGPVGDLDLSLFATVSAFSSTESGSGEPPDRAQICPRRCVCV